MEQSELARLRSEKAQICQQLADATAAWTRWRPVCELPVGGGEKLPLPRSSSGWIGAASSSGKQKRGIKAVQGGT
jgi:hypothetical protein